VGCCYSVFDTVLLTLFRCQIFSFFLGKTSGGKIQGHHVQGKLISGLVYTSPTGSLLPQTIGRLGGQRLEGFEGFKTSLLTPTIILFVTQSMAVNK
jgi:hypothetical protein